MRLINKSHGRKTDKETQSPMLKIFKEIMHKDNTDPEKTNLIKEKIHDRKRKQYSGFRSKSDNRSSSTSERIKKDLPLKSVQEQRKADPQQSKDGSNLYRSDKKDSWWFWAGNVQEQVPPSTSKADTCSCVSCALKKFAGSEYACVGILIVLFVVSVSIAFWMVFRTVPCVSTGGPRRQYTGFGDRLKRDDNMFLKHNYGLNGYVDNALSPIQGLKELEDSASYSELSNIFNSDKINEIHNSEKLKNFYKKLVQTDARIRLLKKSFNDYNLANTFDNKYNILDRAKRSVYENINNDIKDQTDSDKRSLKENAGEDMRKQIPNDEKVLYAKREKRNDDKKRVNVYKKREKRLFNTSNPTGFVIEKKKVLVEYKPAYSRKMVPKCSHAPKDSKSHEKQLKHPFYINSQRLDELLDQFLDRSLPETISDPFGLDTLFKTVKNDKPHQNLNHNKVVHIIDDAKDNFKGKPNTPKHRTTPKKIFDNSDLKDQDIEKLLRPVDSDLLNDYLKDIKITEHSSTKKPEDLDVLLSVSTIINTQTKSMFDDIEPKYPNMRKLMQVEEEDVDIAYNDVNEVLSDDGTPHDDAEVVAERVKRAGVQFPNDIPKNEMSINNPNWKAPILYPEEIKSMIKQAAFSNYRERNAKNKEEKDTNDIQYLEDYLVNEDNRLSKMAQAYSDYGVLEGRKDAVRDGKNSNIEKTKDHRIKLSVDSGSHKQLQKDIPSEGIRFEFRPSSQSQRDDGPLEIYKSLQKHLKFAKEEQSKISASPSSFLSTIPDWQELIYSPVSTDTTLSYNDFNNKYSYKTGDINENGLSFALAKGKRTLKSIPEDNEDVDNEFIEDVDTDDTNEPETVFIFEYIASFDNKIRNNSTSNITENVDEINEKYNLTRRDLVNNTINNTTNSDKDNFIQFYIQFDDKDLLKHVPNEKNGTKIINLPNLLRKLSENITKRFNIKLYDENSENVNEISTLNTLEIFDTTPDMNDFMEQNVNYSVVEYSSVENFVDSNTVSVVLSDESLDTDNHSYTEFNTETTTDSSFSTNTITMKNLSNYNLKEFKNDNNITKIFAGLIPILSNDPFTYNYDNGRNNENGTVEQSLKPENVTTNFLVTVSTRAVENTTDVLSIENSDHSNISNKKNNESPLLGEISSNKEFNDTLNLNITSNITRRFKRYIVGYDNYNTTNNYKSKREINDTNMNEMKTPVADMPEVFHMLSNLFASFDGIFLNQTDSDHKSTSKITKDNSTQEKYTSDGNIESTDSILNASNNVVDIIYPIYDSDMIENTGHRSRVLLSIENESNTVIVNESNKRLVNNLTDDRRIEQAVSNGKDGESFKSTLTNSTTATKKIIKVSSNSSKADKEKNSVTNNKQSDNINRNKTVVKRNIDDSSLIFWNDIYDDEYGVKFDNMENIRDKHSVNDSNFIKSSQNWIENKVKKLTDNIKKTGKKFAKKKTTIKPTSSTTNRISRLSMPIMKKKIRKRMIKIREDDEQEEDKRDFAALTENMKEVCKQAAQAVKETRNLEVKEDNRENAVATSLMGQLVKLMTDLVDYQVQQRTCLRLPADLQNFLQWLTGDESDGELDQNQKLYYKSDEPNYDTGASNTDKPTEHDLEILPSPSSEKEEIIPERSDGLGTLKDVQDLILLYDEMSEEDKIKMAGVKEYLVNQMNFLQKLPSYSDYNSFQMHKNDYQTRFKRSVRSNDVIEENAKNKIKKTKRLGKFIKNFGKKHTKSTVNYYDSLQLTEGTGRDGKRKLPEINKKT